MVIGHIGIVVKLIEERIAYWEKVFNYKQKTEIFINTRQKIKVAFLVRPNSLMVKLIEPLSEESSICLFSNRSGKLHHLCFKCNQMEEKMKQA